jgi:hypothetical protein
VNFAAAAPALHRAGLNILPVDAETKRPLLPWSRWQTERQSRSDIDRLRRAHPDAAAAVVLGGPALVLVDVETDSAAGERSLRKAGLPLPPTAAFSSPRGSHRLYRSAGRLPRRVGALQGVDLLGSGYVIVPPSPGRSWVLDLSHLQDLPTEWVEVACHRQRRRGDRAPEPPFSHPLDPPSPSLQQGTVHVQSLAVVRDSERGEEGWWREVSRLLGIPAVTGRAFRCPLHDENTPSAQWWPSRRGEVVLVDFHRRGVERGGAPPCFTAVEVFAAARSGRVRKLSRVEHALWSTRLAAEVGRVVLPDTPFPVADGASATSRVRAGVALLFQCRWHYRPGAPAPLSWRFVASWCGVNERTSAAALRDLLRRGILIRAGTWNRTTLFLPANFESDRGAS